jgi:phospholipase/lecithinase/hemolysin
VTQYEKYGHPVLKNIIHPSRALVAIWIGINDINDSAKYAVDFPTFYNRLISTLFASVQTLYNLGYRSYLFMNLPPLDRTPANQVRSNPSPNATQITWFNDALAQHAQSFERAHPDTTVHVFDAHAALSNMMDHPARYGIVNTTNFCAGYDQPDIETNYKAYGCLTPLDTYFWFNSGHLTSHVHKELAEILEVQLKAWSR